MACIIHGFDNHGFEKPWLSNLLGEPICFLPDPPRDVLWLYLEGILRAKESNAQLPPQSSECFLRDKNAHFQFSSES